MRQEGRRRQDCFMLNIGEHVELSLSLSLKQRRSPLAGLYDMLRVSIYLADQEISKPIQSSSDLHNRFL